MPQVVWKDTQTGETIVPIVDASQSEIDALKARTELGEEIVLRLKNAPAISLVVLTITEQDGVTTLSAQRLN